MKFFRICRSIVRRSGPVGMIALLLAGQSAAAPPHPDLLDKLAKGEEKLPYHLTHLDEGRQKGIDQAEPKRSFLSKTSDGSMSLSPVITGQFRALAILVDFSDNPASVSSTDFDSLIFGTLGATVANYYAEVSYDLVQLSSVDLPSDIGWQRAPETYAYYVGGANGTGTYPNNSQKLVEDLIDLIDPVVDFSRYDNDQDGLVDGLIVIHAGPGAEYVGGSDKIWSHKWNINTRYRDGVGLSAYTIQPEYLTSPGDQTIGVISHEMGHLFGLPDLYDTDYSSNGVGKWGLMSFGSWLGPQGKGESPAHLCAWSKMQLGWLNPIDVVLDRISEPINNSEENALVYRLYPGETGATEYFLVENRQKIGYDSYLPGSGLLIWHIDDSRNSNTGEWYPGLSASTHYQVALEQADGLYELEHKSDHGDGGDPFPGSFANTTFNAASSPSSNTYGGTVSPVSVNNINIVDGVAYADLSVGIDDTLAGGGEDPEPVLPQRVELHQNYPNPFNPSTTISFSTVVPGRALVEVYNSLGRKVVTLMDETVAAGVTTVTFDATPNDGTELSSGVYFYRIVVGDREETKKMVLLR